MITIIGIVGVTVLGIFFFLFFVVYFYFYFYFLSLSIIFNSWRTVLVTVPLSVPLTLT